MRIIFDENVPRPLLKYFTAYEVSTVQSQGWSGVENGELLALIEDNFDVFILADKNLRYQQNLMNRKIALLELPTNRLPILEGLMSKIIAGLVNIQPASYVVIELE